MTTEELIKRLIEAIEDEFPDANVGRVEGEDVIGLDIGDDTWFIEVSDG